MVILLSCELRISYVADIHSTFTGAIYHSCYLTTSLLNAGISLSTYTHIHTTYHASLYLSVATHNNNYLASIIIVSNTSCMTTRRIGPRISQGSGRYMKNLWG